MKKIALILALFFAFILAAESQVATQDMREGQTYWEYTTDVTLTNTTAQYFEIISGQPWYTAQCITVALDSAGGNASSVTLQVYGRVSDETSTWTQIGSDIIWTRVPAVSADTTIIFTNATENAYRRFKILLTPAGTGTTTLSNLEFKQFYGLP